MKLKIVAPGVLVSVAAVLVLAGLYPRPAAGVVENVLVVRNGDSPVSCRVADYYIAKRKIPREHLVTLKLPDSSLSTAGETISLADYQAKVEKPIHAHLTEKKLTDKVQYIVLTRGVPIRVSADAQSGVNGHSVDSLLATLDIKDPIVVPLGPKENAGYAIVNRYWRSGEPFSHAKYGGYLVTRLDGYTEADAKALVDRAVAPQPAQLNVLMDANREPVAEDVAKHPSSVMLPDGTANKAFSYTYKDFCADMVRASQVINGRPGLVVTMEQTDAFVGSDKPLTVYVSWGSNAGKNYKLATYQSLKFGPRSIVETAVSTSGRTFLPTEDGQSLIADLIRQGAAGAKGYVSEPYLFAIASPTVLLDLYTSGRNLAESYYAASRFIGWKDVVIGDPLCRLEVAGKGK